MKTASSCWTDEYGNLFIQGGQLCKMCGGSSYVLAGLNKNGTKPLFIKCPTPRCINGVVTPVDQDPTSPYYEDPTLPGYRPVWSKMGYSREAFANSVKRWKDQMAKVKREKKHEQAVKAVAQMIRGLGAEYQVAEMIASLGWKQPWHERVLEQIRLKLNLIYWTIICAIESLFKWCVLLNTWVEDRIKDMVNSMPDIKYAEITHGYDHTRCKTINIRFKDRDVLSWTWRDTVGWSIDYWKTGKSWKFFGRHALIWSIKPGKEKYWPAPVWETRNQNSPLSRAEYDYYLEMGYPWSVEQARLNHQKRLRDSGRMANV